MSEKYMRRRKDIVPEEDLREYEAVNYADPVNHRFPLDTQEQIIWSWQAVNRKETAKLYDPDELQSIKDRIIIAAQEHDIEGELSQQLPLHYIYRSGR